MKYYIPFIGLYHYYKSFQPTGFKYGANEVLFAFFMSFYHAVWVAIPIGFSLSSILNK